MAEPVNARRWNLEEDNLLRLGVQTHGTRKWNIISGLVPGRSAKACQFRWHNELSPMLNHGPFTNEEERTILRQYAIMGGKWARIARMLNGRTGHAVKLHFDRIQSFQRHFPNMHNQVPDIHQEEEEETEEEDEEETEEEEEEEDEDEEETEEEDEEEDEEEEEEEINLVSEFTVEQPRNNNVFIDHELTAETPAVDINSTKVAVISDSKTEMDEFNQVSKSIAEHTRNNDVPATDPHHANELPPTVPAAVDFNSTVVVMISDSESETNEFDEVSESTGDPNLVELINKIVNEAVDKSMSTLKDQMNNNISTLRDQMDKTISTVKEEMGNTIAAMVRKEVVKYNNNSKQK